MFLYFNHGVAQSNTEYKNHLQNTNKYDMYFTLWFK